MNFRKKMAQALSKFEDVRLIGVFAVCLSDKNRQVRGAAADALKRLLPRVQESDKQYVSDAEIQILMDALSSSRHDHALTIAILKGFEQIGDARALPEVETLAKYASVPPAVQKAARECLPYLQLRAERAEQARSLLRASSLSDVRPELLLRPAQGSSNPHDEQQLLRPQG